MAIVIQGGNDVFSALAFGEAHPNTISFVQNQHETISQRLQGASDYFIERTKALYEQYSGSDAIRLTKAAIRATQHMFDRDIVQRLTSIPELQQAKLVMQRYIMTNPMVRGMYHAQRCDGYSDTYVDYFPGHVGNSHYDYQKVMEGVVQLLDEDNDEIDYGWLTQHYNTELFDGDVELEASEKIQIVDQVWPWVEHHLKKAKEDPTSPYCTQL